MLALVFLLPVRLAARVLTGQASWYGKEHQGKRMVNGKPFDYHAMTAASRTIPLGRRVKVTFLRTMRDIEVTITDRGPFAGHRIMDLSKAAADAIGLTPYGHGEISIEMEGEDGKTRVQKDHAESHSESRRRVGRKNRASASSRRHSSEQHHI
jgi:rare lipoprotein A